MFSYAPWRASKQTSIITERTRDTMSAELVPYSFNGITQYPRSQASLPAIAGQAQGVYITLSPFVLDDISEKIAGWFAGREEIDIVDVGVSDKQGLGFLMIEWLECE